MQIPNEEPHSHFPKRPVIQTLNRPIFKRAQKCHCVPQLPYLAWQDQVTSETHLHIVDTLPQGFEGCVHDFPLSSPLLHNAHTFIAEHQLRDMLQALGV